MKPFREFLIEAKKTAKDYVSRVRELGLATGHGNGNSLSSKIGNHVEVELTTFPSLGENVVRIEAIRTEPAGKGHTTTVLRQLTELADEMSIVLAVEATGKMREFFAAHGFTTKDGVMLRDPSEHDDGE
jgi:hypothetical protein